MASAPVRDQLGDHLITPQNAALVLIDYQPSQFATVRSMDADLLRKNIVSTVRTARAFGLPIVHSTVNVASGQQQPTVPELAELLEDDPPIDRTTRQLLGGRRLRGRRACHRPAQADLLRALDRGLHGVRGARRAAGGLRGLSRRRRDRRHVRGGPPRRYRACRSGRRRADRMGLARVRAAARLEPSGDGAADRRDRADGQVAEE